jgi:hypothetical protein
MLVSILENVSRCLLSLTQAFDQMRSAPHALAVLLAATGCCPGHLGTRTTTIDEIRHHPGLSLSYLGYDGAFHYFERQNCYTLLAPGKWAVTDVFRVASTGVVVRLPRAIDSNVPAEARYHLDSIEHIQRFDQDFQTKQ